MTQPLYALTPIDPTSLQDAVARALAQQALDAQTAMQAHLDAALDLVPALIQSAVKAEVAKLGLPAQTVPAQPDPASVADPAPAPVAEPDTLVLMVSEDAYDGHAQFVVTVGGVQVGGVQTATASRAKGETQAITLAGSFGPGPHDVAVSFTNDAWGGSADKDRNLYVTSAAINGTELLTAGPLELFSNGTKHVGAPSDPVRTAPAQAASGEPIVVTFGPGSQNMVPDWIAAVSEQPVIDGKTLTQQWYDHPDAPPKVRLIGQPGTYRNPAQDNDAGRGWPRHNGMLRGPVEVVSAVPGERVRFVHDQGVNYTGKGILTVTKWDFLSDGVDYEGCRRGDEDGNFAGLRFDDDGGEGWTNTVVVRNFLVKNCDDGFLGGNFGADLTIEDGEITGCGTGNGRAHNAYVKGKVVRVRRVKSSRSTEGHLFKTRGLELLVEDCDFLDLDGTGSYCLDVPNGGIVTIRRTRLHKGPNGHNVSMLCVGEEGGNAQPSGAPLPTTLDIDGLDLIAEHPDAVGIWNALGADLSRVRNVRAYGIGADRMVRPGYGDTVPLPGVTMLDKLPAFDAGIAARA